MLIVDFEANVDQNDLLDLSEGLTLAFRLFVCVGLVAEKAPSKETQRL